MVEKSGRKDATVSEIEHDLWAALEVALSADQELVIVVDGLDHLSSGETASRGLYDKIHDVCTKERAVKAILLTQPPSKPFSKTAKHLFIEAKTVHNDMLHFIRQGLDTYHHFHERKDDEKEALVHRITDHVRGNFIFAELIMDNLKREKSFGGSMQAADALPKTLHEAIYDLVTRLELSKSYGSLLIAWLLAAERPLTVAELRCLLETRINDEKHHANVHLFESDIYAKCRSLIVIKDEIVRIRHITIRQYMLDHLHHGSSHMKLQDCQRDLVTRCLAYVKYHLASRTEPSLEPLGSRYVQEQFHKHELLEYTVRYWTANFHASTMYDVKGSYRPSPEISKLFPDSVSFALMEWTCWNLQSTITEVIQMHLSALNIRKTIRKDHESVLQCLMTVATTYEKLSINIEASKFYFQASKVAQVVIGKYSSTTTALVAAYLKCTASIKITERNEIANHREEMLLLIIASEAHQHGAVTKEIITYKKILATLYMEIKEYTLASKVQHEIYRACVEFYGEFSSETVAVYGGLTSNLNNELKGHTWEEHILNVFMISERTMKVMDRRRIDATVSLRSCSLSSA